MPSARWSRGGERKALLIGGRRRRGLALSVATRGWAPFALLPFFAAGGMALPALQALMAHKVDDDHQGELQGTLASMGSLIGVAGPLVATALYAATRDVWPGFGVGVGRRPVRWCRRCWHAHAPGMRRHNFAVLSL